MTSKQERFCEEFLIDADPKAAAIRAGYSKNSHSAAANLLGNKEVRENILKLIRDRQCERNSGSEEVLSFLTAVMRGEVAELRTSAKDRMHAAELLGKRYGVFDEKERGEEQATVVISGEEDLE